jgi:hypothetical protein
MPLSVVSSTSTVGLPLESRISLALTLEIVDMLRELLLLLEVLEVWLPTGNADAVPKIIQSSGTKD